VDPDTTLATSNEYIAQDDDNPSESLAQLQRLGRISGYAATFDKQSLEALLGGNFFIRNWISMFETPEGARAYLEDVVDDYKSDAEQEGYVWKLFSVPDFGDETVGLTVSGMESELGELSSFRVTFRRQNVVAGVGTAGISGIAGPGDAIDLAEIVASRIK
jgi:hypothetical protein